MTNPYLPFDNIYRHGFVRTAVCVPQVRVADPDFNGAETIALAREAHAQSCALALFPELGISAYSNEDLFQQDALLGAVKRNVCRVIIESRELFPVLIVGAPFELDGRLFNCAFVIHRGRLLGIVPKSFLPNYREFYEKRHFAAGWAQTENRIVQFADEDVPFGTRVLFKASDQEDLVIHIEVCEDVWTPVPPSSFGALAGATVLANLSASNITVGKADDRKMLCRSQSSRCIAAYLYSAAGPGESTTDLAWDGQASVFELGTELAESKRFVQGSHLITADIDLDRIRQDRMRTGSWGDAADAHRAETAKFETVPFELLLPLADSIPLKREIDRHPFVPSDPKKLDENCYETFNIQVHGLISRLKTSGIEKVAIGISGGLDSSQALIVAARAFDRMGLPRKNILCWTLPGFATSGKTKNNALALMEAFGVTAATIDITEACTLMLKTIGHPYSRGEPVHDVTFENVQAGERTSILFRLANFHNAIVMGTGDLSELALGWCTYGVGDQMSHYNVNCGVPKTFLQHLIRWAYLRGEFGPDASETLRSIVETEISPELVPAGADGHIQSTEDSIGPYGLQDFNLYYVTRFGFAPSKIAYLSWNAWRDWQDGRWPEGSSAEGKVGQHGLGEIRKWLNVFLFRFFQISQFKRSAAPNGPKVVSGGSLSPRGDWRAPSDSTAAMWLLELEANLTDQAVEDADKDRSDRRAETAKDTTA